MKTLSFLRSLHRVMVTWRTTISPPSLDPSVPTNHLHKSPLGCSSFPPAPSPTSILGTCANHRNPVSTSPNIPVSASSSDLPFLGFLTQKLCNIYKTKGSKCFLGSWMKWDLLIFFFLYAGAHTLAIHIAKSASSARVWITLGGSFPCLLNIRWGWCSPKALQRRQVRQVRVPDVPGLICVSVNAVYY